MLFFMSVLKSSMVCLARCTEALAEFVANRLYRLGKEREEKKDKKRATLPLKHAPNREGAAP